MAEYVYAEAVTGWDTTGSERKPIVRPVQRRERVVRCRGCEHSWNDGRTCSFFSDFDDGHIIPASVYPDGFCAWGEPRLERGGMEPPTERQIDFIESIQETLGIEFDGTTKAEASKWIDEHIGAYELEAADPFSIEHGYF